MASPAPPYDMGPIPSIGDTTSPEWLRYLQSVALANTPAETPDASFFNAMPQGTPQQSVAPAPFSLARPDPDRLRSLQATALASAAIDTPENSSFKGFDLPPSAPADAPVGPLLSAPSMNAGQMPAPQMPGPGPQTTGPANSASAPDASPLARLPTLLDMKPPQMPPPMPTDGNNGRPPGIPPTATPANAAAGAQPDAGDGEDTPPNAGLGSPKPPTAYTGLPGEKPTAPPAAIPGAPAPAVSAPPAGSLLAGGPGSTSAPGQPSRPANVAPTVAEPSIWKKLADAGIGDQMIALGAGIAGGKNWGEGLSAGFGNVSRVNQTRDATQAATQIAQTKAQREQAQLLGNAAIYKKYFPNATDQEAIAGGANSAVMTELIKRGLPATETYRTEVDGKGNQWQVNIANGQRSLLKAADEDKTQTQLTEDQRIAAGLPPGVYQRDTNNKITTVATPNPRSEVLSDAQRTSLGLPPGAYQRDIDTNKITPIGNGSGVTINNGGEKAYDADIGKADAKKYNSLQEAGTNARNKLNTLALMEQSMSNPNFYSGLGGEAMKQANQALGALGVKDTKAASGAEVFDALSNQVVLDQLGGSLGAGISDNDRKSIALIGPNIEKTPEGNRQLIGIYRSIAQREQQVAQMARDYADAHNGRIDRGFENQLAQFANTNPLFPVAQQGATARSDGSAGGPVTPAKVLTFDPKTGSLK